jgi:DNA-binding transcriptional regulator PaaX
MFERKHLAKLGKYINSENNRLNLTQVLLSAIALGEKLSPDIYNSRKISQAFGGLRRYKFVRHIKNQNEHTYSLTQKGEAKLQKIIIDDITIKNPKSWDGKWHLVMYDLPIRFKKARHAFRWKLKDLGFFQLQKSAWVYPYPCESELLFVADFFGVRKHIEILKINRMLNDEKPRIHFGL